LILLGALRQTGEELIVDVMAKPVTFAEQTANTLTAGLN
jgi:hypothetical protein